MLRAESEPTPEPITEQALREMGFLPDMPDKDGKATAFGLTLWGFEDSDPENEHVHCCVALANDESPAAVYLEEYDDGGKTTASIHIPTITTMTQLRSLMDALGVPGK
jgi:hypothetical protein